MLIRLFPEFINTESMKNKKVQIQDSLKPYH